MHMEEWNRQNHTEVMSGKAPEAGTGPAHRTALLPLSSRSSGDSTPSLAHALPLS